jgi:hypothetical protein
MKKMEAFELPFLFEDSPFYNDFVAELKDELSKKK